MPALTVILSSFNRPAGLRRAALSVLAQTHRDLGLVICDDASTDAAVDRVMDELTAADPRVHVLMGPAVSPEWKRDRCCTFAALINEALRGTDSPYLSYLTDDCEYEARRCAELLEVLEITAGSTVGMVWGQQAHVDGAGQVLRAFMVYSRTCRAEDHTAASLIERLPRGNFIDHSSVIHRRVEGAWWDESPAAWADLDRRYWLTLAAHGLSAMFLPWVQGERKCVVGDSIGAALGRGETIAEVAERRGTEERG